MSAGKRGQVGGRTGGRKGGREGQWRRMKRGRREVRKRKVAKLKYRRVREGIQVGY